MQRDTKEMLLDKLAETRNEIGCIASALKVEHFRGSGQVRHLAIQVNRLETVLTHVVESL